MLPEQVISTIKDIGACQSSRAVLDYLEGALAGIMHGQQGTKISRTGAGSILVLDQEPRSSRSGPGSLVLLVKIPQIPDAGPLQRTLHVHDDRVGGRGIAKATIVATLLAWLKALPTHHLLGSLRVVFYDWHDSNVLALDQFAAVLPVEHAFVWCMEPTASLVCPVENGSGKLTISFAPGELGLPMDASTKLARDITERFKPSHPVYLLDPNNRLSFRFLPGAEFAVASAAIPQGDVHVVFSHHPLSTTFKRDLVEYANNQGSRIGAKKGLRIRTDSHFPGAKFDASKPLAHQFTMIHENTLGKEPYMDWHVHPSMASAVYKHHPGTACIVYAPGEPFFLDDAQAVISTREADAFREMLEAAAEKYLFRT